MLWATQCLLSCLIAMVGSWETSGQAPDAPRNYEKKLSLGEKKVLRSLVYRGSLVTESREEGKWANFTILVVPEKVYSLYAKDELQTLQTLLLIVEGARSDQALLAAGYAISVAHTPVANGVL